MNNKDILLDVIGDTDESLIPELSQKKKRTSVAKWVALGGTCAAAVIAAVIFLPKLGADVVPSSKPDSSEIVSPPQHDDKAYPLATPAYPDMPEYPLEGDSEGYDAWSDAIEALRERPVGYDYGFDSFFEESTRVFLANANNENIVYSPLSLYMALGMSAEICDGNSRQQILDALSQDNIEALRENARAVWRANYMDDKMAKCVLATSLWTNNNCTYNQSTVDTLAENYYSSVYSGDPGDESYTKLMQDWLNEQTDGMLSDYVSDIKMDPQMILSIASTVNYSGKWSDKFSDKYTAEGVFYSPLGDVKCEFLNAKRNTAYYWGDKFSAIALSLENNGQMRIILPDEGISPQELLSDEQALEYMTEYYGYENYKFVSVNMSVPKFDVSSKIDLKDGLSQLGITDIFDSQKADFSPLSESLRNAALSAAEHDARVMIDEEGCKASALTALMSDGSAMPEDEVDFVVDRPFVFEIVSETGLPLFVGIVNNP